VSARLPLAGVRVVEHGDEHGELCARLLADLGAEVVKVEPPGGSPSRINPPFSSPSTGARSLGFAVRNTNKRSVECDLDTAGGLAAFEQWLAGADLWIDGTRPGAMAARGCDPLTAPDRFPGLVVVSITDFGQTGPYRDHVATDAVMVGLAGLLFRAGIIGIPPVLAPAALTFDIAGVVAAWAALTALRERERTGRGLHVDVPVMDAVLQTTDWGLPSYSVIRHIGMYGEMRIGGGKIYPIVPCKDGYVRPSVVSAPEWRKIREWLGEPDFLQDPHWDDGPARIEIYDDLLRPLYVEHFADMTMIEAAVEGQARGLAVSPLLQPADVLAAPHFAARGTFVNVEVAEGVHGPLASGFVTVDGERVGYRAPAPPVPEGSGEPWAARAPAAVDVVAPGTEGLPWTGVRVLDFGIAGAVPEIARLFAEFGADVVRIENRARPDIFRMMGRNELSTTFVSSSRTKRSFGVDWNDPDGVELIGGLVRDADVIVENLPPGTMAKLGLGADDIHALNPRAIVVSSQSMGSGGEWSHWRGYGANTQTTAALTSLWTVPDRDEPVGTNLAMPDHLVGRIGALVVAALLLGAERGVDPGVTVEIAQVEALLNVMAELFLQEGITPGSVRPQGNHSLRGAPWGVYPCTGGEERWCVITCRDDADWAGLRAAMGDPGWAADARFATADGRRAAADEIDEHIAAWTATLEDRDVMTRCQAQGVPAGYMMYISDQMTDPNLTAHGYVLRLDQPGLGPVELEGPAFRSSGLVHPLTLPAPLLGEHTRVLARDELGLTDAEIDALVARGVLFEAPEIPA